MLKYVLYVVIAALYWLSLPLFATQLQALKSMSLEELAEMEVSIASKSPQSIDSIPAAVFVITDEDIRRSGARNIPELLRMVPGLNVAAIDGSHWAVSSRGFNGRFANKLLVLMDGRSVYTPLYSGVYWNVQDTLLEDIERIEVIRGPGAAIWGANAVNGVINIITRSASDTQGSLVSVSSGDPQPLNSGFRYGGKMNSQMHYRVFAKFRHHDALESNSKTRAVDNWHDKRLGFRIDGLLNQKNDITLQGEIYRNQSTQNTLIPNLQSEFIEQPQTLDDNGGHILTRWSHQFSNNDQSSLQVYYDYQRRDEVDDRRHTFDLEFNYQFAPRGNHHVIAGAGYRFYQDNTRGQAGRIFFNPQRQSQRIFNFFLQDEIQFHPQWSVILGSKFEHHKYYGFEVQPSLRLLWTPSPANSYWLAFSRASRLPSRAETSINAVAQALPANPPGQPFPALLVGLGNPEQGTEIVHAYEAGYRFKQNRAISLDISGFYHNYSDVRSIEPQSLNFSTLPAYVEQQVSFENKSKVNTWGVELASDIRLAKNMRLQAAYSFLEIQVDSKQGSQDPFLSSLPKQSPHHQLSLRLSYDPHHQWESDLWLRYVDEVDVSGLYVPAYWSMDARIAYHYDQHWELSIVGQNLFDRQRPEFNDETNMVNYTEIPRGFYIKAVWRY